VEDIHKMLCHAGSKKVYIYLKDDSDMEDMRKAIKEVSKEKDSNNENKREAHETIRV